jgi:hypothetical protein
MKKYILLICLMDCPPLLRKFVKEKMKIVIMLGSLGIGSVAYGSDWGYFGINNRLNSKKRNVNLVRDNVYFPGATDGYDISLDSDAQAKPNNYPNFYSDIPGYHLWSDYRNENSNIPYDLKLSFQGTLTTSKPNWLEFALYSGGTFGSKPITFESSRLPYSSVVDVRRAIADSNGVVPLIDVPAGTYNQWTPYGSGRLEIGTRLPCDFYEDGVINMNDFAIQANDFGKSQGQYTGDIVGPNGVPDGFVDYWDVGALSEDWLEDVNDPNTW